MEVWLHKRETPGLFFGMGLLLLGFLIGRGFGSHDVILKPEYPAEVFSYPRPLIVDCSCNLIPSKDGIKGKHINWTERYE